MHMNDSVFLQEYESSPAGKSVYIEILGRVDLYIGGQNISDKIGRSVKLRSILCYLAFHRDRPVTQMELIETFWENENQSNPLGALKMQVLRLRNILKPLLGEGNHPIISRSGAYQWNPEIPA